MPYTIAPTLFEPMATPNWRDRANFGLDAKSANECLILGLGNDILCDDAIGLLVAREIKRRLAEHTGIDVSEACEMGLSLLDYIIGYKNLILIDAIQTGKTAPGFVHELEGQNLKLLPIASPHFVGVGEMISLGRNLGLTVPDRVRIFAIEVQNPFTITTEMTPALKAAMPGIVDRILGSL